MPQKVNSEYIQTISKTRISFVLIISLMFIISLLSVVTALRIETVSMNPDTIAPGQTSTITLTIKNNGDTDLSDVSVSLDLSNVPIAPHNSGSSYNINTLDSSKSKDANFQIIAINTAQSGIYKIPVIISYSDDNGKVITENSLISIMINSKPILEVNYDNGILMKGQNNKVTVKIINKGLANVKFLEISSGSSTYYTLLSQNSIYIGDVDSNDFQTADYNLFFNKNIPTTVNFPVTIKYKDITNKEYIENYNIPLKVYSQDQAQKLGLVGQNNIIYIVIIVIVLIVIFFIYRAIRKKRKQNEN